MRRLLGALMVAVSVTGVARADPAKDDLEKLQGDWSLVSLQIDGQPGPDLGKDVKKVVIKGDQLTVVLKGSDNKEERKSMKFKLDPGQKPKAIDLTAEEGPDKDRAVPGIYEIEGDTLKICTADPPRSKDRPKDFILQKGSKQALMVLKRSK